MPSEIKLMIVDDHDMVRLGLKTYLLLEEDIRVVGEASNGKEALRQHSALFARRFAAHARSTARSPIIGNSFTIRKLP